MDSFQPLPFALLGFRITATFDSHGRYPTCSDLGSNSDERTSSSFFESPDDFEQRIFGGVSENNPKIDSFYQKLDRLEKTRGRSRIDYRGNDAYGHQFVDDMDEIHDQPSDKMEGKLEEAAYFVQSDEILNEDYAFRPDMSFQPGMTYTTKDLDLTKPGAQKASERSTFEVTTEEVLKKADFRNVRFLANFITEAGIIIKRSKVNTEIGNIDTGISAKAQRKVAREIKTARAFGLMPFTTMGTNKFIFGKTMEDLDEDYGFYDYSRRIKAVEPGEDVDPDVDPDVADIKVDTLDPEALNQNAVGSLRKSPSCLRKRRNGLQVVIHEENGNEYPGSLHYCTVFGTLDCNRSF
ncbi:hypothetical protein ACLOJK_021693 [Asimina triloba]